MSQFPKIINEVDIAKVKKLTEEERTWLVATILLLSERAGLVTFVSPSRRDKRREKRTPLPKGLISLLEACERQGLITINREKLGSEK